MMSKTVIVALIILHAGAEATTCIACNSSTDDCATATTTETCTGQCQTTIVNSDSSQTTIKSCSPTCVPQQSNDDVLGATSITSCCDSDLCNGATNSKSCYAGAAGETTKVPCDGQCMTTVVTVGSSTFVTMGCSLLSCIPGSFDRTTTYCCYGNLCNSAADLRKCYTCNSLTDDCNTATATERCLGKCSYNTIDTAIMHIVSKSCSPECKELNAEILGIKTITTCCDSDLCNRDAPSPTSCYEGSADNTVIVPCNSPCATITTHVGDSSVSHKKCMPLCTASTAYVAATTTTICCDGNLCNGEITSECYLSVADTTEKMPCDGQCATIITTVGSSGSTITTKKCIRECRSGTVDSIAKETTHCCGGNLCNGGSDSKSCYVGVGDTTTTMPCDGECMKLVTTTFYGDTIVTKSCSPLCTPGALGLLATYCCDENLCNTASSMTFSIISMVVALLSALF